MVNDRGKNSFNLFLVKIKQGKIVILYSRNFSFNLFAQGQGQGQGQGGIPFWKITGNSNADNQSFVGTTNNIPLKFKVNNALQVTIKTNGLVLVKDRLKINNKNCLSTTSKLKNID